MNETIRQTLVSAGFRRGFRFGFAAGFVLACLIIYLKG